MQNTEVGPSGYIYVLMDPRDLRLRYVGKTTETPAKRLNGHVRRARNGQGNSRCAHWIRKLLALDLLPIVETLEEIYGDADELNAAEIYWIAGLTNGGVDLCNQTPGGEGGPTFAGRKHTAEAIEKMREVQSRPNPAKSQTLSELKKAQWQDPEYRERMTTGISEDARERMGWSAGMTFEAHPDERRARISEGVRLAHQRGDFKNNAPRSDKGTKRPWTDERRAQFRATRAATAERKRESKREPGGTGSTPAEG